MGLGISSNFDSLVTAVRQWNAVGLAWMREAKVVEFRMSDSVWLWKLHFTSVQTHWKALIWKGLKERVWILSWTLQVSSISMENSGWMESLSLVFTIWSSWISVVGKKSSANGSRKSSGFSPDSRTSSRAATTRLRITPSTCGNIDGWDVLKP